VFHWLKSPGCHQGERRCFKSAGGKEEEGRRGVCLGFEFHRPLLLTGPMKLIVWQRNDGVGSMLESDPRFLVCDVLASPAQGDYASFLVNCHAGRLALANILYMIAYILWICPLLQVRRMWREGVLKKGGSLSMFRGCVIASYNLADLASWVGAMVL